MTNKSNKQQSKTIENVNKFMKDREIVRKYMRNEITKEEFDKTNIKLLKLFG